tara:strand:- start:381 stop:485 length:105 start_codon:yes stop_codon:yes gene_type:complete
VAQLAYGLFLKNHRSFKYVIGNGGLIEKKEYKND